jgi:TPP-dependent trihydroxycyclohexane-1,2-dione (THcHDO) dehydratase
VDIDGDGSFVMNCQELATAAVEGLETKIMILNNQHLGMVVQWEDRFYKANRAHTYLGKKEGVHTPVPSWSAGRTLCAAAQNVSHTTLAVQRSTTRLATQRIFSQTLSRWPMRSVSRRNACSSLRSCAPRSGR